MSPQALVDYLWNNSPLCGLLYLVGVCTVRFEEEVPLRNRFSTNGAAKRAGLPWTTTNRLEEQGIIPSRELVDQGDVTAEEYELALEVWVALRKELDWSGQKVRAAFKAIRSPRGLGLWAHAEYVRFWNEMSPERREELLAEGFPPPPSKLIDVEG